MISWRAGCTERCTSGSEGGPGKPTSRKADRAPRPDPYTYVSTWSGWVYVAFVTDACASRIIGWRTETSMSTRLVLGAIDQAIWTRVREARAGLSDGVYDHDRGSQYGSVAFSEHLASAGIKPSVGAGGSSFDNASAETINGVSVVT